MPAANSTRKRLALLSLLFPALLRQAVVPQSPPQPADDKLLVAQPLIAEAPVQPWAQDCWLKPGRLFCEDGAAKRSPLGTLPMNSVQIGCCKSPLKLSQTGVVELKQSLLPNFREILASRSDLIYCLNLLLPQD